MKGILKFLDGRFFVPLLVIVLGIIRWGLRAYDIGPKDTSMDVVLIGFFLSVAAVLWILDRDAMRRRRLGGKKSCGAEKQEIINDR